MEKSISHPEQIFIPREEYNNKFCEFLHENTTKENAPWIYYQYDAAKETDEKGGIGKTLLLSEYCRIINNEFPNSFWALDPPVIDFIEIKYRSPIAMWSELAGRMSQVAGANFEEFHKNVMAFLTTNNTAFYRLALEAYVNSIKGIAEKLSRKVVFFFDTFETIQDKIEQVERKIPFPIPGLKDYCVVVINSRNKPNPKSDNWTGRADQLTLTAIGGFKEREAIALFEKNSIALSDDPVKIVNYAFVKRLNDLAHGRPILLALAIDYIKKRAIEPKILQELQPQNFQKEFIEHLNAFKTPPEFLIRLMAHVFYPWDRDMIEKFLKELNKQVTIFEQFDSNELFDQLSQLSFVRSVGENALILHDEMRDLIARFVWEKSDANRGFRKEISGIAATFFQELAEAKYVMLKKFAELNADQLKESSKSSTIEQVTLRQEYGQLKAMAAYHKLYHDFDKNFSFFISKELTPTLDQGNFEEAELYLTIITELNRQIKLDETNWNRVLERQLRLYIGRYYLEQAQDLGLKLCTTLQNQLDKVKSGEKLEVIDLEGRHSVTEKNVIKILGNVEHYVGQVFLIKADYTKAKEYFERAGQRYDTVLLESPDDYHTEFLLGRNINWLGYNQTRQSFFEKALEYYENAEPVLTDALFKLQSEIEKKGFPNDHKLEVLENLEAEIKQWIAQVYGNKCVAFMNLERLQEAENYGWDAHRIRQSLGREIEIVKSLNALGLVFQKRSNFDDALDRYYQALDILQRIQEPLLLGRVYTNLGTILLRRDAFSQTFFFSDYDSLQKQLDRLERSYSPQYEKSLENLSEATRVLEALRIPSFELANVYFNMGEYYMIWRNKEREKKQEWENAKKYLYKGVEHAKSVKNAYIFYDALQRILAIHYYSCMDSTSFQRTLLDIEKIQTIETFSGIRQYPGLFMRVCLLKGNFIIDSYLRNRELPLENLSMDAALETAYRFYYDAAKAIYPHSKSQYNKIINLIDAHQREKIPKDRKSYLTKRLKEWANEETENKGFVQNFELKLAL